MTKEETRNMLRNFFAGWKAEPRVQQYVRSQKSIPDAADPGSLACELGLSAHQASALALVANICAVVESDLGCPGLLIFVTLLSVFDALEARKFRAMLNGIWDEFDSSVPPCPA